MVNKRARAEIRLRIVFDSSDMIGPGKADLLEFIAETGSISAAGKKMNMSYKRAWSLVSMMNAMFSQPVVESTRGGRRGGGAWLTESGKRVLAHYRRLEAAASVAGAKEIEAIEGMLRELKK